MTNPNGMTNPRLLATLLTSAVVVMGVVPAAAQQTTPARGQPVHQPAAEVDAPVPEIDWDECDDGLRCATVRVPLDYDEPHGATTELALKKHPATDRDARVGTMFVNPGGPGNSAVGYVPWFAENLPDAAIERFDVVGVDPRGVGGSSPLACRAHDGGPDAPETDFPTNRRQVVSALRYDRHVRRSCATGANPIVDHMTTADTARDMDLIRQAVGDERLTYYGISYGSVLGATYAAMFPGRIRAMVVDGVMDPIAYTTGHRKGDAQRPSTARWGSAEGSWQTLTAAFAECDRVGRQRCPIAGEATATWRRVMDRLERGPVTVGGERIRYQDVVVRATEALSDVGSYRSLMRYIGATHDAMFGPSTTKQARTYTRARERIAGGEPAAPLEPVTEGVICSDSLNPGDPRAWVGAGERADRRAPWFGKLWAWRSSLCAGWTGSSADAYRGPFATRTSAPVLLVAHLHDPKTPIRGARVLNTLLQGSRMLALDGWGHGALGESDCVGSHVGSYLVSADLPDPGTVCQQDEHPFPQRR